MRKDKFDRNRTYKSRRFHIQVTDLISFKAKLVFGKLPSEK
jgi:hypothetical protein